MKMANIVSCLSIIFILLKCVSGFATGGPPTSCVDSYPKHNDVSPQAGPAPYVIELSSTEYAPNDNITVTIRGRAGETFRGFQLRAQRAPGAPDVEQVLGEFVSFPETAQGQTWYPQASQPNCVTHVDGTLDKTELVFVWQAPPQTEGDLVFRSPFLQEYIVFWYDVESEILRAKVPYTPEPFPHQVSTDFSDYDFLDGCGDTKGCFVYPTGCQGDGCDMAAAYSRVEGTEAVRFHLMGNGHEYISIGISHDKKMGQDFAVTCLNTAERGVSMENAYLPALYSARQRITALTDMKAAYHNGRIYCSFTRDIIVHSLMPGSLTPIMSNLSEPRYLFLARGKVRPGTVIPKKHDELPVVSEDPVIVTDTSLARGQSLPTELQVHGTLGVLSYFYLLGFALLLARHYREELSRKVCDSALWFQSHRAILILVPIIASVCVIIIAVYLKAWTKEATIHAVFGLVALGLMLINVIAGLARPGPGSSRRPTYNVLHRLTGVLGYVCAVVTVILASRVSLLPERIQTVETVTMATGFGLQILIALILEIIRCRSSGSKGYDVTSKPQDGAGFQMEERAPKNSCWNLKFFCLLLYVIGATPIAIVAIYYLYN